MESPRRPSNAMVKHASARRLFTNVPDRLSGRNHGSSNEGHARRRLVLVPDDQAADEGDGIREPSVVARLMGLESFPGDEEAALKLSPLQAKMNGEVTQLQELLKIKEPFLLGELLREAEDQPSSNNRKPSLIQKFTGFLKRRPAEINVSLEKSLFAERQKKQLVLSPVKSPRNVFGSSSSSSKVSPIKSPCKSKRGLMLEAAVKFLDIDQPQQQSRVEKQQQQKRKFSLSRSSSEPCLNSASSASSSSGKVNIKGELKGGLSKLSENVGRELSKRFGVSTGSSSSTAASAFKNQSKSRSSSSNLFRSKSDLGLGKTKHQVGGLGLLQQQQAAGCTKQDRNEQDPSFSRTAKMEVIKNSSGIGIRRLFGNHRCKDNRTTSDGRTDTTHSCTSTTTRSGEASSLVRSLLLRRKNASTKTAFQRSKQVKIPPAGMDKISQSSSEVSIDDLSSAVSESLQFSDEFSDDSTRSVSSGSPPNSRLDGCECNKSGQPSPVSVLEAAFVDEIHTPVSSSSSVEDSPEASSRDSKHGALTSTATSSDNIMNAILDISRIRCIDLSAIGINELPCLQNLEDASTYVDEVLTTSQLLCEESSGKDWFCEGLPINLETFDMMEEKLSSNSNSRPKASLQARKLIFHCVDEAVDARLSCFRGKAGSSAASRRRISKQEMVTQIHGQITDWSSMSSCSTDELVEKDMNFGRGKWTDWNEEVNEITRDLECSLLRKMIEEVAREIRRLI